MSNPVRLKDFFEQNSSLPKEDFLTTYPHPFLIFEGKLPKEIISDEPEKSTQRAVPGMNMIATTRRMSAVLSEEEPPFTPVNPERSYLFSLKKKDASQPLPVILGRDENCDLALPFEEISGRHVGITWSGEPLSYTISDLGSTNGTFLNTFPLEPNSARKLSDQDVVKMGKYSFLFYSPYSLFLYATSPLW